ncbi:MAG: energy-coupling factor transporter transmembrane protein EcfT [Actinomycetota bacterium]|nr:energy-coupling factor transporter transmembrane protein EcfT [Actinomycetota bacterium]
MTTQAAGPHGGDHGRGRDRAGQRRQPEVHLLRLVPGDSFVHRLWAGTRVLVLMALALATSINASWASIAICAAVVGGAVVAARIPLGAFPKLPGWIVGVFAAGGVVALASGGAPYVRLPGAALGLAGLLDWLRLTALAITLLIGSFLVGWTTPLSELAPAVSRMLGPLRRIGVPVDEIALAVGLAVRCLGLLLDDLQMAAAARRLRRPRAPLGARAAVQEMYDLLVLAMVLSVRRAREIGDAMEARGGLPKVVSPGRAPGRADAAVLAALVLSAAAIIAV